MNQTPTYRVEAFLPETQVFQRETSRVPQEGKEKAKSSRFLSLGEYPSLGPPVSPLADLSGMLAADPLTGRARRGRIVLGAGPDFRGFPNSSTD